MRISDWSSDVCSSDLVEPAGAVFEQHRQGDRPGCLPAIVPRRVGKALPQRLIERYQPLPRGNLDRQRSEHLGYRADLVAGIGIDRGLAVPIGDADAALREHALAIDQTHRRRAAAVLTANGIEDRKSAA